ncbi:hypothetical protein [Segetibacter aerophilus]|uniref:Uncharacterized protein n=1 Tax=Segetibacter aerophilus TaxID=670293 RepID=A0A512BJT6_9BACT|nr:hypothetical protein [Segetibacter aerophilus]GEO12228.1 hypothetical protein SAE01_47240 [Segetibacter aerophilus]
MPEEEDFLIEYKGKKVNVSPVINGGNIYFIIHFETPVTIAEGLVNEDWLWYEEGQGQTILSAEIGELIEKMDS